MDKIVLAIQSALRTFLLFLCEIIYYLITFFFNVFQKLGTAEILKDSTISEIYERIGLILGLFMIFRVTFSLIQYIINPDLLEDKQKGVFNVVKKMVVVVVLLGITPSLFNLAFDVQELIINSKIIPKIIVDSDLETGNFGSNLAWHSFSSFYNIDDRLIDQKSKCQVLGNNYPNDGLLANDFNENGSLSFAYNCLDKTGLYTDSITNEKTEIFLIKFDGVLAVLVGCLILWMVVMYTIQVGVRVVQLAYLRLIAPIPIILYLDPKNDEQLNKWVKQCTTTYLDFFIRTAIIYFVIFVINLLIDVENSYFKESLGDVSGIEYTYITLIMIIALLVFAKKAPDLFKELFPSSSGAAKFDFGLSPKKNIVEPLKYAYNSPLGWGIKAGLKAGTAIDRKVHHLPKPRSKIGQAFDKWLPGRAEVIKNKNEIRERKALYKEGKSVWNDIGCDPDYKLVDSDGKLKPGAFRNKNFRKTWQAVYDANDVLKKAETQLKDAELKYAKDPNQDNKKAWEDATRKVNAARSKLDEAKKKHEDNKKTYDSDARREVAFDYFKSMQDSASSSGRGTPSGGPNGGTPNGGNPNDGTPNGPTGSQPSNASEQTGSQSNNTTNSSESFEDDDPDYYWDYEQPEQETQNDGTPSGSAGSQPSNATEQTGPQPNNTTEQTGGTPNGSTGSQPSNATEQAGPQPNNTTEQTGGTPNGSAGSQPSNATEQAGPQPNNTTEQTGGTPNGSTGSQPSNATEQAGSQPNNATEQTGETSNKKNPNGWSNASYSDSSDDGFDKFFEDLANELKRRHGGTENDHKDDEE